MIRRLAPRIGAVVGVLAIITYWSIHASADMASGAKGPPDTNHTIPLSTTPNSPQGTRQVTITLQTFEGDTPVGVNNCGPPPCWMTYGTPLGTPTWGITSCDAYRGTHSAWCAVTDGIQPCPGEEGHYFNNMDATISYGLIDLSDAIDAVMQFWVRQEVEAGFDRLYLELWGNGRHDLYEIPVIGSGWQFFPRSLNSYLGDQYASVGFRFVSDGSVTYGGVYIDDVWIVKRVTCNCVCQHDSYCDGNTDILDVTQTINVAFRGQAPLLDPNSTCPFETTDVDCNDQTDIVDVTKMINVAFRGMDAGAQFCNRCP